MKYSQYVPDKSLDKSHPIDVVVTWVNTTDPEWILSYEHHNQETFKKGIRWSPESADPEAELSICLELVRKNMPWVRHTWVLTASPQRPKCLINEILIHHDAIGLTPVFNAFAIESSIHLIPGLSENFIYLNDDMYVRRPVYPSEFITKEGHPLLRFQMYHHQNNSDPFLRILNYTAKVTGCKAIMPDHTPYSLTKSMMQYAENTIPDEWVQTRKCIKRYSCVSEIVPIVSAMQLALANNTAKPAPKTLNYILYETLNQINKSIMKNAHFACINSLDGDRAELCHALQID